MITPATLKAAREAAGYDHAQAAKAAGYAHRERWTECETGAREMPQHRFDLFKLRTTKGEGQ